MSERCPHSAERIPNIGNKSALIVREQTALATDQQSALETQAICEVDTVETTGLQTITMSVSK